MSSPEELQNDPEFMASTPADQIAYLSHVDPEFKASHPDDQAEYLAHVTKQPAVPEEKGALSTAADYYRGLFGGKTEAPVLKPYKAPEQPKKSVLGTAYEGLMSLPPSMGGSHIAQPAMGESGKYNPEQGRAAVQSADIAAQKGAEMGASGAAGLLKLPLPAGGSHIAPPVKEQPSQESTGIAEGIGGFVGGMATDPRMITLVALPAAEVGPILNAAISGKFAAGMSKDTIEGAKALGANWDNISKKERASEITRLSLTDAMAGSIALHTLKESPAALKQAGDLGVSTVRTAGEIGQAVVPHVPGAAAAIGAAHGLTRGVPAAYFEGKGAGYASKYLAEPLERGANAMATFKMSPKDRNVELLTVDSGKADKAVEKAIAAHSKYEASEAKGAIDPEANPAYKKSLDAVNKAREAQAEAHYHLQEAKDAAAAAKEAGAAQPEREITPAEAALARPDQPTPTKEENDAKLAKLMEQAAPTEKPAPTSENVKVPGQVQPETFPQEPTVAPRVDETTQMRPLGGNKGVIMGRPPRLLTEGVPEAAPEAPKGEILPPKKPATATEMRSLKPVEGKVIDTQDQLQSRLEEGLQGKAKPFAMKSLGAREQEALGKIMPQEANPEFNDKGQRLGVPTETAQDLGKAAREAAPEPKGRERRASIRTAEDNQNTELFRQARQALGENATSDEVAAKMEELKAAPKPETKPAGEPLTDENRRALEHRIGKTNMDLLDTPQGVEAARRFIRGTNKQFSDMANYLGLKGGSGEAGAWLPEDFKRSRAEHGGELSPKKEAVINELRKQVPDHNDLMEATKHWGPDVESFGAPAGGVDNTHEAAVKEGGGEYKGVQEGVPEAGLKGLVLFDHPETHSSLALPEDEVTPEAVKAKLEEHKTVWDKAKKSTDAKGFYPATHEEHVAAIKENSQAENYKMPESMKDNRVFTDGKGIFYSISPDGEIQRFVNNSKDPGALLKAARSAIDNGGKTIDAWDLSVPKIYEKLGFKRADVVPYDEEHYGPPSEALKAEWKKQGWKEEQSYPAVQNMVADEDSIVARKHNDEGGSSFSKQGDLLGHDGYSVGINKELEHTVDKDKITSEDVKSYRDRPAVQKALKDNPKSFIGTWVDGGKTYFDTSIHELNLEDAKKIGEENDQRAVFDLKNKESINLDEPVGAHHPGEAESDVEMERRGAGVPEKAKLYKDMTPEEKEEFAKNTPISGGAPGKAIPTGDQLIKKYGESDGDPAHTAFLLPDGRGVSQTGTIHDEMLGGKATDENPRREQFVSQGNIRMRSYGAYGDRQFNISIPESGITPDQLKELKRMAPQLSTGRVYLEVGKPGGETRNIDYNKADAESLEKNLRELAPVVPEGYPKGTPKVGGGAPEETKLPEIAEKHLLPEEKEGVSKSKAQQDKFVVRMTEMPELREWVDAASKGAGERKWYQRSTAAFDALSIEAPNYFDQEGDRDKFIGLLAAGSPQQSVVMNMREALKVWTTYVDNGRPTGAKLEKLLSQPSYKGGFTLPGTKIPNAMKALAGETMWPDISKNKNFKVPSFQANLTGMLQRVTNDGWMALFSGLDARDVSSAHSYHPISVMTRAAAEELGWEPAEAQAAIWAFIKTLTEKGVGASEDPVQMRQYSEDFADIMKHDPETRALLKDMGVSHAELDKRLAAIEAKPAAVASGVSPTSEDSAQRAYERVEKARGKGTIPASKTGLLNFGEPEAEGGGTDEATSFNPKELEAGENKPVDHTYEFKDSGTLKHVDAKDADGNVVATVLATPEEKNPNTWTVGFSKSTTDTKGVGLGAYSKLADAAKAEAERTGKPVVLQGDKQMTAAAIRTWVKLGEQRGYDVQWDKNNRPRITFRSSEMKPLEKASPKKIVE